MISPRGSLATRRITAYWGVLAAAALTTLVAATVAAALAVFAAQALPLAARHDLAAAQGTSLAISGPASRDQVGADGAQLRQLIGGALPGVPLHLYQATWSDPLGLVPGARPAVPRSAGTSNTPILEAAAVDRIARHAVLVAGTWPGQPAPGQPVPTTLAATSAALLHVSVGDVLGTAAIQRAQPGHHPAARHARRPGTGGDRDHRHHRAAAATAGVPGHHERAGHASGTAVR